MFKSIIIVTVLAIYCQAKWILEKVETCGNPEKYQVLSNVTVRIINYETYIDVNTIYKRDVGENDWVNMYVTMNKIKIYQITERDPCKFVNKNVGVLWQDLERAARINPSCPFKKGVMHVKNFHLNVNKMAIQSFPPSEFQITTKYMDRTKINVISCMHFVAKSVKNV